tara:strand:- start:25 stop:360 length:336 start_codon:yes stop_codon:yes gene_type:complete
MNKKLSEMPVPAYARIVDEWYKVMGKNNISVQPKAATILGTILSKYDIKRKQQVGWDVYDQYMNTPVAELSLFISGLSDTEQVYVEECRAQTKAEFWTARDEAVEKQLLRG